MRHAVPSFLHNLVFFEVFGRRGSLEIKLLAKETLVRIVHHPSPNPTSSLLPKGVNGRPRHVSEEDDDNEGWTEYR
jgi:hypothetical protein